MGRGIGRLEREKRKGGRVTLNYGQVGEGLLSLWGKRDERCCYCGRRGGRNRTKTDCGAKENKRRKTKKTNPSL